MILTRAWIRIKMYRDPKGWLECRIAPILPDTEPDVPQRGGDAAVPAHVGLPYHEEAETREQCCQVGSNFLVGRSREPAPV